MILADKIIRLRKRCGWSQEELAEKMNVSRQAVSKWEGAQTVPDLEKILQLSTLFGVTTDYLLKDEIEDEEFCDTPADSTVKRISIADAADYLALRKWASYKIALATLLCILSPIPLFVLGAACEEPAWQLSETVAGAIGLVALFAIVLCAVPIYIYCGFRSAPYEFLEKGVPFELEYGVRGIVTEEQRKFRNTYVKYHLIASVLCVFSPVPLLVGAFTEKEFLVATMLGVTMAIAGIGVFLFIVAGVQNASMQKLLKEGEYTPKESNGIRGAVETIYWGILTAIYLAWSFLTFDWHLTWIIFAVGGALFPAVLELCNLLSKKQKKD